MKKKQRKAQLLLISIGLLLVLLTYFYYPYISKDKLPEDQFVQKDLEKTQHDDQLTTFESVEYEGLYDLNKSFLIKSEKAYILDKEPDIVYMTNMHVILYLSDKRIVNITSDKGRYNKVTHDCFFEENVEATEGETKIFANNLDLLATENFAKAYNNVKLNNSMGSLIADKLEYDFEKKYFNVSNFDKESIKMKIIR
tara:strand:- start:642 stop:1232 length:591 start_codon:yes stop_codon:yes gene_type:complete